MPFQKDFLWGTATASFQIEGAADKRGDSIWDAFCRQPGRVYHGHDGRVACDHVRLFREDVKLMKELGLRNYRFSVSWPRVIPDGCGEVNREGLQFYSDLVDCLLENGIRPFVTLYHWDLPQALQSKGGFSNPQIVEWFRRYTEVVARCFGDRVKDYMTFNEPQCIVGLGYWTGAHAPGFVKTPPEIVLPLTHRLLQCHGAAAKLLRELSPDVRVGFVPCHGSSIPATDKAEDVEAARSAYFSCGPDDYFSLSLFCDPVVLGRYPDELAAWGERFLPQGWEKDLEEIRQPLDFLGINIYTGEYYRQGENGLPEALPFPMGSPQTASRWEIVPDALYWGPRMLYERYRLPIFVTENGCSCHDVLSLDGKVHDPNRIDYLHRYLLALRRAAEDGVKVGGYFQWSLLDNFEWSRGYAERFGIVYVDYRTQRRVPKDSAYWYAETIRQNGENL